MAGQTSARSRARFTALGMALTAVVLTAGCGDSEEPSGSASPAATTSATETATESPTTETPTAEPTETSALPPLPEEATENTPEGAEAFIRYYFDVVNVLYQEPAPGLVPQLSDPGCESCGAIEEQIVELASNSQRAETDAYDVQSMERVGGSVDGVTTFNMVVDLPANAVMDESGTRVSESGAATYRGEGAAVWEGDSWALFGLSLQP